MDALLLLLLDSRAPAGGHSHSGGMEPAVGAGLVRDVADVEAFCRGRLRTAGRVAADAAGLACATVRDEVEPAPTLARIDAEVDARSPSEAVRGASRQLGRGLLRLTRAMLPGFAAGWAPVPLHHAVVLGAAVAAAGSTPDLAARAAALNTVNAPASGAVRLLGLDPFAVQGLLARLASEIDSADWAVPMSPEAIAADTAPALDLLADVHLSAEVRLFAS